MWWVPHQWNISEGDGCHFQAGCIKFAQFFALLCSWKLVLKMAGPQDGRNLHLGNLCVQEINLYCVKALRWGSSSSVTASNMTLTSSFISHNLGFEHTLPCPCLLSEICSLKSFLHMPFRCMVPDLSNSVWQVQFAGLSCFLSAKIHFPL